MKLFSNTTGIEQKAFAANDDIIVPYSHLSLYGTSTPDRFYESISGDELTDGFLARILLFESRHNAPYPKTSINLDVPKHIIDQVNALHPPIIFDTTDGNLMGRKPKPKIIPLSPEASEYHEQFSRKYHDLKNETKADGFGKSTIYGRAAEHSAKLALIHTMSLHGPKGSVIDLESIEWAWTLMEYIIDNTVANVKENVVESVTEKWKNKIIKEILSKQSIPKYENGLLLRDLQRGVCKALKVRELKELLNSMLIGEELGVVEEKNKNNVSIYRYFVAE